MRTPRIRLTYANVVSTLALFLALGGVSYAAVKLPANSVGEKQIKKNAVTGKKIKKSTITGSKIKKSTITADKIKNGTLTGADINAGTLGKVPSAARADSAGSSDQVIAVSKRVAASAAGVSQDDSRQSSPEVPLASNGQVSVYGKCYVYSGTVYAELLEKTAADGALSSLYSGYYYYGGSGYLNTSTLESQRSIGYATASANYASYLSQYYGVGTLFGPDGNGLNFQFGVWAKQGNVATYGNGAFGPGNVCVFTGHGTRLPAG